MKVQCDVCQSAPASLICCADEAALCAACDARVHEANKLASKHQRVPFVRAPAITDVHVATHDCDDSHRPHADCASSSPTLCDVCQERASFFLCVEDRAVLCRDCDVSIHSANPLVGKHTRLLLTGIRVALEAITCTSSHQSEARQAAANSSRGDDHPHEQHSERPPSSCNASALKKTVPSVLKINARQPQSNIKPSAKSDVRLRPHDRNTNHTLKASIISGKLKLAAVASAATCNVKASYRNSTVKRPWNNTLQWQQQSKKLDDRLKLIPTHAVSSPSPLRGSKSPGLSIQRLSLGSISFVAPVLTTVAAAAAMAAEAALMADDNHDAGTDAGHTDYDQHQYDEHLLISNDDDIHHDDQNCQSTTSGETSITDILSRDIVPLANNSSWRMDNFLEEHWDVDDVMGATSLRGAA